MAKATISDLKPLSKLEDIKSYKQKLSNKSTGTLKKVSNISSKSSIVLDIKPKSSNIKTVDYPKKVKPEDILPFKIKITNLGIDGVNPLAPPGIGVQIIGFSNYII
jgi:hypothetical protein